MQLALDGLSVGDALGERFFFPPHFELLATRTEPRGPWRWTDDTAMALSIAQMLAERGGIDQDQLATAFARRFMAEPDRGYGRGAYALLHQIGCGVPWDEAAQAMFDGSGSMGNGAAMRAAPIGAYFAEHLGDVADHAAAASQVTHMHSEGIAGGVAVAVAAGWACRQLMGVENERGFFETVVGHLREGTTRQGIDKASTRRRRFATLPHRRLPPAWETAATSWRLIRCRSVSGVRGDSAKATRMRFGKRSP
ncbi:MAG: ADP-ribosylglycohydrolase family protein [Gemmataceae bacterium]